jgi:hypothetical protein
MGFMGIRDWGQSDSAADLATCTDRELKLLMNEQNIFQELVYNHVN